MVNKHEYRDAAAKWLHGNFAPINEELCGVQMEVIKGAVPVDLHGSFLQTVPNPQHLPLGGLLW